MITRVQLAAILGLAAILWAILLYARGGDITLADVWPFGAVVGAVGVAIAGFEKYFWHLPLLHGWFVARPDLRGTWRVELFPNAQTPGYANNRREGFMQVTQTLGTLQMRLFTDESESWLHAERVYQSSSGRGYEIAAVYMNRPRLDLRGQRSEIHYGSFLLRTTGPDHRPTEVTGEYWTDRGSRGRMRLSERVTQVATSYEEAAALYDTDRTPQPPPRGFA